MDDLDSLETPALLLDKSKAAANARRLRDRLASRGVVQRPHVKTAKNVDVVCMAFAMKAPLAPAAWALNDLEARGTICVAAYNPRLPWPHADPSTIAVGRLGGRGDYDLGAPDSMAWNANAGQGGAFGGTSTSCAIIAGVAACAKSHNRSLTRKTFLSIVQGGGDKVAPSEKGVGCV